jgi:hypothetical protein
MNGTITKPAGPPTAIMRQTRPGSYDDRRIMRSLGVCPGPFVGLRLAGRTASLDHYERVRTRRNCNQNCNHALS